MEKRCVSGGVSDGLVPNPKSDSKIAGEKRISTELGQERDPGSGSRKRVKMRDLKSVCQSEGIGTALFGNKESSDQFQSGNEDMSQVTEVPIKLGLDASQARKPWSKTLPVAVNLASRPLDLNTNICTATDTIQGSSHVCTQSSEKITLLSDQSNRVNTKGIGLDLNAGGASVSEKQDPFYPYKNANLLKPTAHSECGSSTGPIEEKDSMKLWKQMKQNGFLSSTQSSVYGGIPIPKPRAKKVKNEEPKKKPERPKREHVNRFAKIAAPTGLLNELNPGIINHVRNRKQVRSIIESLVRLERENDRVGNMQATTGTCEIGNRKELENMNDSGRHLSLENWPPNTFCDSRQTRGFPIWMNKSSLTPEDVGGDGRRATIEEDTLELKLSSSTMAHEDGSPLFDEESASYLSFEAANVASQWLGLVLQDIKGRLAALRRSRKRVRDVITTELPALLAKEFSSNQENDSHMMKNSTGELSSSDIADLHQAKWGPLFQQMHKGLSEEETQLESWFDQVKEMQLHCDQGLQLNTAGVPPFGTSGNDSRSPLLDDSDGGLAVKAAAASIYSTCNFLLSANVAC